MFRRLGIRDKVLIQGLLTVIVALVLVVTAVWAALWVLGWRQARERLTQASRVASRSLAVRIADTEASALRVAADKELTGKTGFVLEESGRTSITEMVASERRNLALALGRAIAASRATEAAIYGMDGQLVCATVDIAAKAAARAAGAAIYGMDDNLARAAVGMGGAAETNIELWCPDDHKAGQLLHAMVATNQAPQPDDWREATPHTTLIPHPRKTSRVKTGTGCVMREDGFWITATVPIIGMRLNPDTFAAEPLQHGVLTLRRPLDAGFVREQCELTGTRMNLYINNRLIGGTVSGYLAPDKAPSGGATHDGLAVEALAFSTVSVAGTSYFAALAPLRAESANWGSIAIMLPQTETRRSLMWVTALTVAAGIVAALLATVVGLWLSRAITRPIKLLLERATYIAQHRDLEQTINIASTDEIGQLATAFNQMLGSLKAYYLDLQSTNARLQDQIAQRRLAESTYRTLYESTSDAVLLLRSERVVNCNAAALRLFGYTDRESFIELQITDVSPDTQTDGRDSSALAQEYIAQALRQGSARFEWMHRRADGSVFEADVWLTAIQLDSQHVVQAVVRDITEAKRAQEELERLVQQRTADLQAANEHLQREIAERRRAEDRAEAASQAKSLFLANMSHEIRTPMTAILGFAELLTSRDLRSAERLNHIETIRRNGQHLLAIINDILDLSKIEAGRMVVETTPCSITQILQEVASLMQPRAIGKNIDFKLAFASPMPGRILSDPIRIRQILINLVGNAIKFTERGSVRIVTRLLDEPALQFDIIDTGIGITPEQLDRIFLPFAQAESSTSRRFGGTGLGLTISTRLAEMLGGSIRVHSQPGEGSTFTVTVATGPLEGVPMVNNPSEAMAITHEEPTSSPRKPHALDCSVLLAEDGPDNRRLFAHILKVAGARVTTVENGSLAVQAALAAREACCPYDIILMDMQMPVMDGYQATTMLRAQGYRGSIIALTAHAMATDREKCLAAGCDDYATKPINRRELMTTIREQLDKGRQQQQPQQQPTSLPQSLDVLVSELADDEDLRDLVVEFVAELPKRIEALRQALAEQDLAVLVRLAHQLKGSAGGYGFPQITEAAAGLEHSAQAGEDLQRLNAVVEQVAGLCARARANSTMGSDATGASERSLDGTV